MYSSNRAYEASVRVHGRPVKEVHHRGHTYVEGRKGTEYTLHFKNHQKTYRGYENQRKTKVLVIPSVDGLCVIDGKPAGRNSPGFIITANESIDIPGWIVDSNTAAKFTFWPQDARGEATYVEELSKSGANVDVGNQGLIGFLVIEEHFTPTLTLNGHHFPKDIGIWNGAGFSIPSEYDSPRGMTVSANSNTFYMTQPSDVGSSWSSNSLDAGIGTKFGQATNFQTTTDTFKRGKVLAELVIEYDTLRGLKDRGVPVHLFKGSNKKYGERSAFPADTGGGCVPPKGWRK